MLSRSTNTKMINVLITSFGGLGLPNVLSIPTAASTLIEELEIQLSCRLPQVRSRLILTTTSRKCLSGLPSRPISSLLSSKNDTFLPLRLSTELCGGKGGFGSQLRAAGGRMSSRRKKNQGDSNSSNRNLDGRRLRTVAEAKALAEYLALKPDMEKKEKEARRSRWEQVVELAEKREAEVRMDTKGRVDAQWVADKEEAEDKTREAVFKAFRLGTHHGNPDGNSDGSSEAESDAIFIDQKGSLQKKTKENLEPGRRELKMRTYHGFDDDETDVDEIDADETDATDESNDNDDVDNNKFN